VGSRPLCKLQKGCTRLAATSDKDYQLLAHGRWFSPEILLKVALNTKNQSMNQLNQLDEKFINLPIQKTQSESLMILKAITFLSVS